MATDHQHHESIHGDDGAAPLNHETTDIPLEGIGRLTLGFVLLILTVSAAMYGTFLLLDRRANAGQAPLSKINADRPAAAGARVPLLDPPNALEDRGRPAAGPELLTDEGLWLRDIRAAEVTAMTTYGWVDKDAGVVRVPIERAKQLILEAGLPVTAPAAAPADPAASPADPADAPAGAPGAGSGAPGAARPPAGQ